MKTGTNRVTDVAIVIHMTLNPVLDPCMHSTNFPAPSTSFRSPIGTERINVTWLVAWPKVGKDLINFVESLSFAMTPREMSLYRQAAPLFKF